MKRKVNLILILLYLGGFCSAQQVVSSGGYAVKSDISVNWILGGSLSDLCPVDQSLLVKIYQEQLMESELALNVYPVPANDFIYIKFNQVDTGRITYELYNNTGIKVIDKTTNYQPLMQLNISDIPSGIYYLKIFQTSSKNQLSNIKKVIKQ